VDPTEEQWREISHLFKVRGPQKRTLCTGFVPDGYHTELSLYI
jgi:hypothetical protein